MLDFSLAQKLRRRRPAANEVLALVPADGRQSAPNSSRVARTLRLSMSLTLTIG